MNKFQIFALKSLRKAYMSFIVSGIQNKPECVQDADLVSNIIYKTLIDDKPCMIARFGANELNALINYQSVTNKSISILKYVKGGQFDWWWNNGIIKNLHQVAGFYPPTINKIEQFCELMIQDIPEVDVLGSWLVGENIFKDQLVKSQKVHFRLLEPFWSKFPWTSALADKKVLVVHPFAETILSQYKNRDMLFSNPNVLPKFISFVVIKAVQSLGEGDDRFNDWFDALDFMKSEIDKQDFDVCLIGCGAYGFHLAAHVKRSGKKAVHLGGALQLLFGIKGNRWEDANYGVKEWGIPVGSYSNLMNEYWVRPGDIYKPKNAEEVEGACYW